jgi:AcrR family transcriptional regulator
MDRRQALKDTAMRLFVEEGFQQTSTARVSKVAGVATGTLFTYFASKDDLINTVYAESKSELMAFILEKVNESDPSIKILKSIWKQVVKWGLTNPVQYRFIQLFEASAYGLAYAENHDNKIENMITEASIELGNNDDHLPESLIIRIINSNQNALIDYLLTEENGEYNKALTKQMLDVTLAGLMK